MKKAQLLGLILEYMMYDKPIKLSNKGKVEVEKCWEGSSTDEWRVHAINNDETIKVVSEMHDIHENADLDWFVWEEI